MSMVFLYGSELHLLSPLLMAILVSAQIHIDKKCSATLSNRLSAYVSIAMHIQMHVLRAIINLKYRMLDNKLHSLDPKSEEAQITERIKALVHKVCNCCEFGVT